MGSGGGLEAVVTHLEVVVERAELERDHWKKAAEQRGQTMTEALERNTFLLQKAMESDRALERVRAVVAKMLESAAYSRRLADGGISHANTQLALQAAECRERDTADLRAAIDGTA